MTFTIYNYVRHPRAHELHHSEPAQAARLRGVEHESLWVRLNAKLGLKVTLAVGSMWAAYLFAFLALFALPDALRQGTYFIVVWLSSSFLQLVLLPIIIVGQNIQARAADKRLMQHGHGVGVGVLSGDMSAVTLSQLGSW